MASYPGAIKTFTNPNGTQTLNFPVHSDQHADANDEITAIETELGVNPSGSYPTVVARLDGLPSLLVDIVSDQTIEGKKEFEETLSFNHGVNVASAGAMTLGDDGNIFKVTGTTSITSITIKTAGTLVCIYFEGILTVTDGSNLDIQGDFITYAGASIVLASDGTNWVEISRSKKGVGDPVSITIGAAGVQATTDGQVVGLLSVTANGSGWDLTGYTDSASTPTTVMGYASGWRVDSTYSASTGNRKGSFNFLVKKGNYYRVDQSGFGSAPTSTAYFIPNP